MNVSVIDQLEDFLKVRPIWEQVFSRDQNASVFMSWSWLRGWFEVTPFAWSVLAVREDGSENYIAFLPVSLRGGTRSFRLDQVREIHMAGDPAADYTGFVCLPEHETAAIDALADFVANEMTWDRLRFAEVDDPRLVRFQQRLTTHSLDVQELEGTCCPFIPLPETWDEYLEQCLSYETRRTLRKKLRKVERECRVSWLTQVSIDNHLDALLPLLRMRSHETSVMKVPMYRPMLQSCAQTGDATVAILWKDETPIAGVGIFIDKKKKSYGFYQSGFDERFGSLSPGRIVRAMVIRDAIEKGMKTVDFLRGDEQFKFDLGAERRFTRMLTAVRKSVQTSTRRVLHQVRKLLKI